MKFTLIYDGPLHAGPSKRALYASKIRNQIHPQLRDLWDNHVLMRQLAHEARVYTRDVRMAGGVPQPKLLSDYMTPPPYLHTGQVDLAAPIEVNGVGKFLPIVRESLHIACSIDILFLRHEEPMQLFEQSGDIDNRLKCFFDGLAMPDLGQLEAGDDPCASPLCVLLENDRYISDFSVRSGRLLGKDEKHAHDVRIQADITIKVLRVFVGNLGLVGG